MTVAAVNRIPIVWTRVLLNVYVLAFFVFILAPIVFVVVVSFSDASFISFPVRGWSLRWYARVFAYVPFTNALRTSMIVAAVSATVGACVAVPAALALSRARGALAMAVAAFLLSPISIPAIVLGFALLYYLSALGVGTGLTALIVAHTVIAIPYVCRTVLAVHRGLPGDYEEAAQILGASHWSVFLTITLPLIRPGIFAGGLFAILVSLDNLPISFFFGNTTSNVLPVVMLSYMQNQFDPAIAAISTLQMLIAVAVLLVVERFYGLKALVAT